MRVWEPGLSHPGPLRDSEPRIILILFGRTAGQKAVRLKGERKEGQAGEEVAPPREAQPGLTASLVTRRAG